LVMVASRVIEILSIVFFSLLGPSSPRGNFWPKMEFISETDSHLNSEFSYSQNLQNLFEFMLGTSVPRFEIPTFVFMLGTSVPTMKT
jgi:hypothetical protein